MSTNDFTGNTGPVNFLIETGRSVSAKGITATTYWEDHEGVYVSFDTDDTSHCTLSLAELRDCTGALLEAAGEMTR